ncbi:MAG TPA: CDP-archaeol synthase [Longimicrobiales bacterium]|nr:CDP-archaeol synthase [Longimicrobiales bacterium]
MAGELTKRVAVAAVGIPLAILVLYIGGWVLGLLLALIAALGAAEFIRIARLREVFPVKVVAMGAAVAFVLIAVLRPTPVQSSPWFWLLVTAVLLLAMSAVIWTRGVEGRPLAASAATLLAPLLTGGTLTYAIYLREALAQSPYRFAHGELNALVGSNWAGFSLVAFPLAVTWIHDTFAYFGGRKFGRHKLIPRVSPGKTREGTIAGLIGAILTAVLYGQLVFEQWLGIPFGILAGILGGVLLAAGAVIGDLAESLLKREAGVKDSGTLLPGHGGVLDRFDALYFTLPIAYWFLHFVLQFGGGLS